MTTTYRPDHNGECLNCDEWFAAHGPDDECPALSLLLVMAHDWANPAVVRDSPERAADVVKQLIAKAEELEREVARLKVALHESVKLQSHYADLLNMHDGGKRIGFADADAWIARLRETGTLT